MFPRLYMWLYMANTFMCRGLRMSEYIVRETGYPGTIKQDDRERREK